MIEINCSVDRCSEIGVDIGSVDSIGKVDYKEWCKEKRLEVKDGIFEDLSEDEKDEMIDCWDEFVYVDEWDEEKCRRS